MDDEDSKARRNFMAVSTIIVLAWWLEAPLDKISEKLLGMPSVGPGFEWRAWFAALVALLYFALRFRFSTGHADAMTDLNRERQALRLRVLEQWLSWEATGFIRFGVAPILGQPIRSFFGMIPHKAGAAAMKVTDVKIKSVGWATRGHQDNATRPPQGELYLLRVDTALHRANGSGSTETTMHRFHLDLAGWTRALVACWVFCWLAIYSKTSTSFVVPWLIGAAAAAVCGLRTWQAAAGI